MSEVTSMRDPILIRDDTPLDEIDQALRELAVWRHAGAEAEARFNAVLEERFARTAGA